MLRGETIAFHIYSLANISRGDKYPATIQLYSQYIPFITIKLVNPPLCFHHQDFWRLKNNFWWLNMCLLAITQKITGLVESGTLRETMLIKFSSIFHHISGCFPYFFPETNPSWNQYFININIYFFFRSCNMVTRNQPQSKKVRRIPEVFSRTLIPRRWTDRIFLVAAGNATRWGSWRGRCPR